MDQEDLMKFQISKYCSAFARSTNLEIIIMNSAVGDYDNHLQKCLRFQNLSIAFLNANLRIQKFQITINLFDENSQQISDTLVDLSFIIKQPGTWLNSFYGFQHSYLQPIWQKFYLLQ
ncbi:unnamed protein product [Paramecium octaurelia]|uniref:Uncharacterized protein n=1 Tax=Paramecium octaurelia TaxID=43137 RepID=A0A8S1VSR6_PAROT|nr:unnamed protein product [Paramecium octaurelia]